ncbi:MAG: GtrA family protein [Terriglobales bacterium]|jgi:putative flippase GtrA
MPVPNPQPAPVASSLAAPAAAVPTARIPQRSHAFTVARYLAVGACNTIFGYGCFALFTLLLTPIFSYGYVAASLLANLFGITFSFLGYKWFVFKTKGNYLKEWIRCVGVYSASMVLSAAALPFVVAILRRRTSYDRGAPYIAGALVLVISVVFSFFGHRHISFADRSQSPPNAS